MKLTIEIDEKDIHKWFESISEGVEKLKKKGVKIKTKREK